jgi:hypothetical protein
MRRIALPPLFVLLVACGPREGADAGPRSDAAAGDASMDASARIDAGADTDAGAGIDAGADTDAGAGIDAGAGTDAGADAGLDASLPDAGFDASLSDAGPPSGGCISGATGTHVLRFRWTGTTSGSTAYVVYEANTLPDTTRWRVGAYSSSIGYRPVFSDPFLGEGGLDLSGTVFIDVELSTDGLSAVRNATLAIYGRSFNTTASGSFEWQTFSGTGASPYGGVSNVAPYAWYGADATAALPAGDSGTLLRIRPGPPSDALIVARVEICFDAT